jgi:hypothetical protein
VTETGPKSLRSVRLAYQPPAYFSLGTNQPPATSQQYFLSEQTSTSHQPPAKRTGCYLVDADAENSAFTVCSNYCSWYCVTSVDTYLFFFGFFRLKVDIWKDTRE